jgi:hypothetical protein
MNWIGRRRAVCRCAALRAASQPDVYALRGANLDSEHADGSDNVLRISQMYEADYVGHPWSVGTAVSVFTTGGCFPAASGRTSLAL